MRKIRILALVMVVVFLFAGCVPIEEEKTGMKRFEASFLNLFDTVTSVVGYADTKEAFQAEVDELRTHLEEYHQLYDIYHTYEGMINLKTVNDNAGIRPVKVDARILDLLEFAQKLYALSNGKVNAAMGSVLSLWHESREAGINDPENAALPDEAALKEAQNHCDFDNVVIDRDASTVYIQDPKQSLDVGAIAKGYALEQVCREITAPMIVSLGGNVRVTGPKPDGSAWVVGVQDPNGGDAYLHTLYASSGSVVTSGDYQRYYTVDGVRYHHIIDPDTGYPANRYRGVTVLCQDSGLADGLSTALFNMSREDGEILLKTCAAEAMWVLTDGSVYYSPGFSDAIRT